MELDGFGESQRRLPLDGHDETRSPDSAGISDMDHVRFPLVLLSEPHDA